MLAIFMTCINVTNEQEKGSYTLIKINESDMPI